METMKIRLLTMKIRSLLTLVGLAFGFAVPALASFFQGDLAGDVKALDEFTALRMKEDEAFNKNDAAALAALFTEDAVYVVPEGLFSGRQAIEKRYAGMFKRSHLSDFFGVRDQAKRDRQRALGGRGMVVSTSNREGSRPSRGLLVRNLCT